MKRTTESFSKEVFELTNGEYEVKGEYKNSKTKVLMKHNCNTCGNCEWEIYPGNFLQGNRCPSCYGNKKMTSKEFKERVYELVGDEYEVLEEYKNSNSKILVRHNSKRCNYYEWEVFAGNFLKGNRCPLCQKRPNRTTSSLKYELKMLVGDEFTLIGEYKGNREKITLRHNCSSCENYEFKKITKDFIKNPECPACANKIITAEKFRNKISSDTNGEYTVIGDFKNYREKVLIKHNLCDYEYEVTPGNFSMGCRCPKCAGHIKKTTEEFKERVFELVGDEYEVLDEYKNNKTKILMRHNCENCDNFTWKLTPQNFLNGVRCPKCKESKGEREIENVLKRFKINYKVQYKIEDCKNINPLPFDFAVFDKEGNLKFLIEYQGGQHYGPIEHFGGEENFINLHIRDKIKEEYCNANNIVLFTIPYTRFKDIQVTLEYRLKKYGLLREAA